VILTLLACASPSGAPAPLAARAAPLEITPLVADADGALIPAVAGVTPLRYVMNPAGLPYVDYGVEVRGQETSCGGPYGAIQLDLDVLTRAPDGGWLLVSPLRFDTAFVISLDEAGRSPDVRSWSSSFDVCPLSNATATATWLVMDLCTGATASAVVELPLWIDPYYCAMEAP
jgi:hypothetical protein